LSRYHEKSSILLKEPEKIPQAKRGASFGVKRAFKGCPWLFLVTIITVETFLHEAGSRHPKAQLRERIAPGRKSAAAQPRHKKTYRLIQPGQNGAPLRTKLRTRM
jgi:hypothetical protein